MTVEEFLKRQKGIDPTMAIGFLVDLLTMLDEFDTEACSVFAGKIRAHLDKAKKLKQQLTDLDLIDLCSYADKLDATGSELYAIQFNERLEELERLTGLSIPEIKNRAREYHKNR